MGHGGSSELGSPTAGMGHTIVSAGFESYGGL